MIDPNSTVPYYRYVECDYGFGMSACFIAQDANQEGWFRIPEVLVWLLRTNERRAKEENTLFDPNPYAYQFEGKIDTLPEKVEWNPSPKWKRLLQVQY